MTVELTKDYATAERDLREHGYCLLESVLPAAQLTGLRDRVAELAEQERRDSTAYIYDKDSQRIFSLHAKGDVFPDIIEHQGLGQLGLKYHDSGRGQELTGDRVWCPASASSGASSSATP